MKTVKKGILLDMLEQLSGFCEKCSVSVPRFKTYDGSYLGNGKYEFDKENETEKPKDGQTLIAKLWDKIIFWK